MTINQEIHGDVRNYRKALCTAKHAHKPRTRLQPSNAIKNFAGVSAASSSSSSESDSERRDGAAGGSDGDSSQGSSVEERLQAAAAGRRRFGWTSERGRTWKSTEGDGHGYVSDLTETMTGLSAGDRPFQPYSAALCNALEDDFMLTPDALASGDNFSPLQQARIFHTCFCFLSLLREALQLPYCQLVRCAVVLICQVVDAASKLLGTARVACAPHSRIQ